MLATSISGLVLIPLTEDHSLALYTLIQHNRAHLTTHGDYEALVATPPDKLARELADPTNRDLRFGIFLRQELVGRMDLIPVEPPRYGLGYWLAENATGKGYATVALNAVLEFASSALQASDIFAGVTHGNLASVAVLERNGFVPAETFESYTRFHRTLGQT